MNLKKQWIKLSKDINFNGGIEEFLESFLINTINFKRNNLKLKLDALIENKEEINEQNDEILLNKQKKFLELMLKIQHLQKFLTETKEEQCDRNKHLRNGIWDFSHTVFELLDKLSDDNQQCCILQANDRSIMSHFDSTSLGICLFYYKCLQPAPEGKFYYTIMNLPKITYISFKKSFDGLSEDVLNWTPLQNVNLNSAIQTVVITDSSFDYPPYNFDYYSQDSSQNGQRPNTYKICIDQVEFEKFIKDDDQKKSKKQQINSEDILYIFEKIIYPLIRSHGPSIIVMNHNFSYSSYNHPSSSLEQDTSYHLEPVHFASILQSLGMMCHQKMILVSNNKFSDYISEFELFKTFNQNLNNLNTNDLVEGQQEFIKKNLKVDQDYYKEYQKQVIQSQQQTQMNKKIESIGQQQNQLTKKEQKVEEKNLQRTIIQDSLNTSLIPNSSINVQFQQYSNPESVNTQKKPRTNFSMIYRQMEMEKKQQQQQIEYQQKMQFLNNFSNQNNHFLVPHVINNQNIGQMNQHFLPGQGNQLGNINNQMVIQQNNFQNLPFQQQSYLNFNNNLYHNNLNTQQTNPSYDQSFNYSYHNPGFNYPQQQVIQNYNQDFIPIGVQQFYQQNQNRQGYQFQNPQNLSIEQQQTQSIVSSQSQNYLPQNLVSNQQIQMKNQQNVIIREQMKLEENVKIEENKLQMQKSNLNQQEKELLNKITRFYLKMLDEPILNNNGKYICHCIIKQMNITNQLQCLTKKLLLFEQQQQKQLNGLTQDTNLQTQGLKIQTQIEQLQNQEKQISKSVLDKLNQNKSQISNFLVNWQIVVNLIKNDEEIEKTLLSNMKVVSFTFNQNQEFTKDQLRVVSLIFSLYLKQKQSRQQMINLLTINNQNSALPAQEKQPNQLERVFNKQYSEYCVHMLVSAIYSTSEIQDVSTINYKKSSSYLANVNPAFQKYIQEINKQLYRCKKQYVNQYFLEQEFQLSDLSQIVRDTETGLPDNITNTNFININRFKDNQESNMNIEKQQKQIKVEDNQNQSMLSNLIYNNQLKNVDETCNSQIVKDTQKFNEQSQNNAQGKEQIKYSQVSQQMEEEDKQKQNNQSVNELHEKIAMTLNKIKSKSSKECLKFEYETKIKGLKHITNLKEQFYNTNASSINDNQKVIYNQINEQPAPRIPIIQQQQYMNSLQFPQQNEKLNKNQYNQMQLQDSIKLEYPQNTYQQQQNIQSNNPQQQYQQSNFRVIDKQLIERLSTKKVQVKKLFNEIYDIRQQRVVKLQTQKGLIFFNEDSQIQVIYLPNNKLEIYLFNLKFMNKMYHVVLTQSNFNTDIFDASFIEIKQQDISLSSSLCYSEHFVFKLFGVSPNNQNEKTKIEVINRKTKDYLIFNFDSMYSLTPPQMISDFSSSCFQKSSSKVLISSFGGLDSQKRIVTQVGLLELDLKSQTYYWKEVLNKSNFLNGYLDYCSKIQNGEKKCISSIQAYEESKKLQLNTEKNVKDFWKRIPLFFPSSQSVYDEKQDCIYVFGGNANHQKGRILSYRQSIIGSALSCNNDCWEKYLSIAKFENVSTNMSLKEVIFMNLNVKNMQEIYYRNNIFQTEKKIESFFPNKSVNNESIQQQSYLKGEFTTSFRHNNILFDRVFEYVKQESDGNNGMELEQQAQQANHYTFVIQSSHPTQFKQSTYFFKSKDIPIQPHQLISMAFSLHTDPLPKVSIQMKLNI